MSQAPHAPWPRFVPPAAPPGYAAVPPPAQPSQQHLPTPTPGPSGQLRPPPTTYPAVSQSPSASFSMPPPLLPLNFDATRPPPPIPSRVVQPINNGLLKRRIDPNGNAGSSKTRKPEGPEVSEAHCESCVQRELRIDGYKQKMEALHNEEETQILQYKKKLQEYEIGRDILKTIVGPELFTVFDNLIEGRDHQSLPVNNPGSFIGDSPTVSKQALLELIEVLLAGDTSDMIEPVPSTSRQHAQASSNEPARYGVAAGFAPSAQSQEFGARALPAMPSYAVAGPSGYGAAAAPPAPAPPPPAAYPVFHPAIPPPQNRPYYGPAPASGAPNMPYNGTERAPGPGPAQGMQPPGTAVALRPAANAPNYNYMGRYPQPPYFPPYQ